MHLQGSHVFSVIARRRAPSARSNSSLQRTRLRSPLNSISLDSARETCLPAHGVIGFQGPLFGFSVAGSPRLRARCCAARTRPTGLSPFMAFPSISTPPHLGSGGLVAPRFARRYRAAQQRPAHTKTRPGRIVPLRIALSSGKRHPVQEWAGARRPSVPLPMHLQGSRLPSVPARRGASSALSNPSLQRTRLRSPLNSISLYGL